MSERKYRQRGYQDNNRDDRERRQRPMESGRSLMDGAPRGRGVGLPPEVAFKCAVCGVQIRTLTSIAPDRCCDECGNPLHTCTNCTFFDSGARFECRKPVSKRIDNKAKGNACSFYQPKTIRDLRSTTPASPADARAAFNALFKK